MVIQLYLYNCITTTSYISTLLYMPICILFLLSILAYHFIEREKEVSEYTKIRNTLSSVENPSPTELGKKFPRNYRCQFLNSLTMAHIIFSIFFFIPYLYAHYSMFFLCSSLFLFQNIEILLQVVHHWLDSIYSGSCTVVCIFLFY